MVCFAAFVDPNLSLTDFHKAYYGLLTDFANRKIERLIISVPPQHGKSYGASHLLPAYLLGIDPELRICIGSYSFALARRFGLGVQRVIESERYSEIFPKTKLKTVGAAAATSTRTAQEFDIVGHLGGVRLVGREGSLTGNRVDVMILDDLYKDAAQANSPTIRDSVWDWYCSVVKTRLHNSSREIIVFTRWNEDDLIGRLMKIEGDRWHIFNFPALKVGAPTDIDPRKEGQALWPERHSEELLLERRRLDPQFFEALYQGNPTHSEGLLYNNFALYSTIDEPILRSGAYIDTADTGSDFLCAIYYSVGQTGKIYIVDVLYTDRSMEYTELEVARRLSANDTQTVYIESNNGGRGFARSVARQVRCRVVTFHQSASKEARILSNATEVMRTIVFPYQWQEKWREFYQAITSFQRKISANANDDAADALTGVIEKECERPSKIAAIAFR